MRRGVVPLVVGLSLVAALDLAAVADPGPGSRGAAPWIVLAGGRDALMRGDFEAALIAAGEVSAGAPIGDKRAQSAALLLRGEALLRRGALDDAELALDAALGWLAKTSHTDLLVRILVASGELQQLRGRMAEARSSFDEAERWALAVGLGDSLPRDEADRLVAEGRLFAFEARGDEALERFERAAQACRRAEPAGSGAMTAEDAKGLVVLSAACVARAEAQAASTRLRMGDLQRARRDLMASLGPLTAAGWELERAAALGALARTHLAFGDIALATLAASEASAVAARVGSGAERAELKRLEAEVSLARGERALARRQVEESRGVFTKLRSPRGVAASRLLLGRMAIDDRRIEEARIHLEEAARLARELDDADAWVESEVLLASVARTEGKDEEEVQHLMDALARGPEPRTAARAGLRLATLLTASGQPAVAREALEVAADAAERIPLFRVAPHERDLAQRERQAIYDALLASQLATGAARGTAPFRAEPGVHAALATAERSAARGLTDLLERSRALRPEAERAMRALDGVERQERSLAAAAVNGDGEAKGALERLGRQRAALESEALGLAPSALDRGMVSDWGVGADLGAEGPKARVNRDRIDGALDRIAGRLSPEVAILKFHVAESASHLFVVTREGGVAKVVHRTLPGRAVLAASVQRYIGAIGTAPDRRTGAQRRAMVEDGRALFGALVEPALEAVGGRKRLIFVPHRELRLVPFDALPWPAERGGGWLAERFVTSTGPSLAALVTLEQSLATKAGHPRHAIAAFGDPVYSQTPLLKLPRLEATVAEVRLASQLIQRAANNPDAGAVFLGADASEARLKALALSRYRVLHLATHGFAPDRLEGRMDGALPDGDAAREPFGQPLLVLGAGGSEDGLLTIDEVLGLNLDADLVVLSACSSGRGALEPGDGLGGLVNAFLYAGSAGVLATLWPIEDRHAASMMETFYRELGRGARPVFALDAARVGAISGAPAVAGAVRGEAGRGRLEEAGELRLRGMGGITGDGAPRPMKATRGGARRVDPFFWAAWVLNGAVGDLFE